MEKITVIVSNLVNSVQVIVDVLINLAFQPVFVVLTIVQNLIEIWSPEPVEEETDQEPQQTVTTYSSANDGRRGPEEEWDCDYPLGRIGFKINHKEQEEIDEIKRQLNKK